MATKLTPILVTGNITAAFGAVYEVFATATFTDPATPKEGGYLVRIFNGTATVGGLPFTGAGVEVWRAWHSGAWQAPVVVAEPNARALIASTVSTASLQFEGSGVGTFSIASVGLSDWSMIGFARIDSLAAELALISNSATVADSSTHLLVATDGALTVRRVGTGNLYKSPALVRAGVPFFFAVTYVAGTLKLFVNTSSASHSVTLPSQTQPWDRIGAFFWSSAIGGPNANVSFWQGTIARASILNLGLTDAEVLDLANSRLGVPPPNLQRGSMSALTAGSFVVGYRYRIATVGTTDFTLIGASANTVGVQFTATGVGTGTGTALQLGALYVQPDANLGAGPVLRGNYGLPDTLLTGDGHTAGGVVRTAPLLSGPTDIEAAIDGASGNSFVLGADVQRIPPGWCVTGARVFTPTGQGAANVTLGTTSGGTEICGSTAVSANAFVTATLTAAQPVFAAGSRLYINRSATLDAGSRLILTIAPVTP